MEKGKSLGWAVGVATKVVGSAVLSLVLGGVVIPVVVDGFAKMAETLGIASSTTSLATSKETKSLLKKVHVEIESEAPKAIGEAIQARLAPFGALPRARISVVQGKEPVSPGASMPSSFAVVEEGVSVCPVVVVVDSAGRATLPRNLEKTMGLVAGEGLSKRLTDFEMLHELGHCAARQSNAGFDHPELNKEQNKLLASAMKGTETEELWGESYADAYAGLSKMEEAKSSPTRSAQTRSDLEVVLEWRRMGRLGRLARVVVGGGYGQAKLAVEQGSHVTEMTLQALLSEPKWLDSKESIEKRAAQLASVGLARTLGATTSPQRASERFTAPKERLGEELRDVAKHFRTDIESSHKAKESRGDFIKREGEALARRFAAGGAVIGVMGPKSEELVSLAWDVEAMDATKHLAMGRESRDANEINEDFARSFMKSVGEWGLVNKLAEAPEMRRMEEKAKKAWARVSMHEARNVPEVDDPRPAAMARASKSEQAGEGLLIKGFYKDLADPPVSRTKLDQWRGQHGKEQAPTAGASKMPSAKPI